MIDSAAETPCHAINITFYCHPERSEGSRALRSFASLRMTPK
ncbi:hypothetical protein SBF1_2870006 [Candidatus Desulfosporosinus infrequens]|uniref:Uncharacterized protein n=1 Tax=Candidatus Desulfosporosinus infrequens TaxID=2043169 RepID=A0A2U3KV83_9FIRM|nr:hypothetical protein SBF1_2870006 [Candidatus Desulfosporosinus infrequens]